MSDQPTESAPEVAESQALPTPAISQPSEAKPPSAALDLDDLSARLEGRLLPKLEQLVQKSTQSFKDRRLADQGRSIAAIEEELRAVKTRLEAHGGDVTKAARDVALDEMFSRQEQSADLGKVGEDWQASVSNILKEAEQAGVKISRDDPELRAVASGTYGSWPEAYAAISRVVLRRAKGVPAAALEVKGATSATPKTVDQLSDELTNLNRSGASLEVISAKKVELLEAMKSK